jgi:hypothetical protein
LALGAQIAFIILLVIFLAGDTLIYTRTGSFVNPFGGLLTLGALASFLLLLAVTISGPVSGLFTFVVGDTVPLYVLVSGLLMIGFVVAIWRWWILDREISSIITTTEAVSSNFMLTQQEVNSISKEVDKQNSDIKAIGERITKRENELIAIEGTPW